MPLRVEILLNRTALNLLANNCTPHLQNKYAGGLSPAMTVWWRAVFNSSSSSDLIGRSIFDVAEGGCPNQVGARRVGG